VQVIRSYSSVLITGWAVMIPNTILAILLLLEATGLISTGFIRTYGTEVSRIAGFVGGVGAVSFYMTTALIVSICYLHIYKEPIIRFMLIICGVVLLVANINTVDLTGLFTLSIILPFCSKTGLKGISLKKIIPTLIGSFCILLLLFFLFAPVRKRICIKFALFQEGNMIAAVSSRTIVWKAGAQVVRHNPILGVGAGNVKIRMLPYLPLPEYLKRMHKRYPEYDPHNSYISLAADYGIFGLLLFLYVLWNVFSLLKNRLTIMLYNRDIKGYWIANMILLVLLATLIFSIGVSCQRYKYLWIFLGLGIAFSQLPIQTKEVTLKDK